MLIERKSPVSGEWHKMNLDITEDNYNQWKEGKIVIQKAFPNLTEDEREFLLSGMTKEDWDETFKDWDEEIALDKEGKFFKDEDEG